MFSHSPRPATAGFQLVLVLVYAAVFVTILAGLIGYVVLQNRLVQQQVHLEQAISIAESGLNYYKWYLAHNPGDATHGTTTPGPYVQTYADPEGGVIGEYSLEVTGETFCGETESLTVRSTGRTYENPNIERTVTARVAQPSVATYAFITNAGVWYGSGGTVNGPVHSNQGIRMEADNNSSVTSGVADWTCNSSYGCNPSLTVDGVYSSGGGSNPGLFAFPSEPINFAGLTVDLNRIKTLTQDPSSTGLYFAPTNSGLDGYQLTFNGDDTVTVNRVAATQQYWAYNSTDNWHRERNIINTTNAVGTFPIEEECPVIFVEDKVWLQGDVSGKVTVAAGDLITTGETRSIVLNNSINYTSATSSGLTAIAQDDVQIGLIVPDDMDLNGIFIAQSGNFNRSFYCTNATASMGFCNYSQRLPGSLQPYALRNSLTRYGTVVSNTRAGINWIGSGTVISGFQGGDTSYDRNLANDPPPLTPRTSDVSELFDWEEVR